MSFPHELLQRWFLEHRRDLPWRENRTAYAVWISEVMLQQTQAAVVEGYFLRWMQRFPTLASLSAAPLEEVIKLWEGLGYYSRVRHLHAAAQWLVAHHGAELPASYEQLILIKGLGRYTVGAILSFAFQQKRAAVDGNTIRVLSRYYAIQEDVQRSAVKERIWALAEDLLPDEEPWLIVEGLIELGALLCKREPLCASCPLQESCQARQLGIQRELPKKGKKIPLTRLLRHVFVITCEGAVLVKKGKKGAVMADLYEFPFVEVGEAVPSFLGGLPSTSLPSVEQSFTRFRVTLKPSLWTLDTPVCLPDHEWIPYTQIHQHPFSSGHRKILQQLQGVL